MLTIVGLTGSLSSPSRTRGVVESVLARLPADASIVKSLIDVAELVPELAVRHRGEAPARVIAALDAIESADLLIVGTPVYKGSYSGMFKHLIDLLNYPALLKTPVGLIACGGSDRHALAIEHELRPLFGFFGAKTLPTGVFLSERCMAGGEIVDAQCRERLDSLIAEAVHELDMIRARKASLGRP